MAFDVGANIGQTASQLIKYLHYAQIFCFEPTPSAFGALKRVYGDKVECIPAALGRAPGSAKLSLFPDSQLNTFAKPRVDVTASGAIDVPVITIDQFCQDRGIGNIDVLKMDVQGWEMEVLAGAADMLAARAVQFIYAEVGFRRRDTDMQSFARLNDHLDDLGYEFCGLYEQFRWGPAKTFLGFANALYALPGEK